MTSHRRVSCQRRVRCRAGSARHEEDYFQKRDRDSSRKCGSGRRWRAAARARREVSHHPELSRELAELGFTAETVKLLPLIPVLEMAWAEGEVTAAERKMVVDVARGRGIEGRKHGGPPAGGLARSAPRGGCFPPGGRLINALFESEGRFSSCRTTSSSPPRRSPRLRGASLGSVSRPTNVRAQSDREPDQGQAEMTGARRYLFVAAAVFSCARATVRIFFRP